MTNIFVAPMPPMWKCSICPVFHGPPPPSPDLSTIFRFCPFVLFFYCFRYGEELKNSKTLWTITTTQTKSTHQSEAPPPPKICQIPLVVQEIIVAYVGADILSSFLDKHYMKILRGESCENPNFPLQFLLNNLSILQQHDQNYRRFLERKDLPWGELKLKFDDLSAECWKSVLSNDTVPPDVIETYIFAQNRNEAFSRSC